MARLSIGPVHATNQSWRSIGALRANKLLRPETRDLLFTPQPELHSPSYGYGFMIMALPPDAEVGHGGTFPGTTARLSMFLDSGYTFTALVTAWERRLPTTRRWS